jgi:uncharacterized protein YbjT (DUF2867 family)
MTEILVTGGTGHLGRELVPRLITEGHGVRILSRQDNPLVPVGARAVKGDLTTGDGLVDATAEVDVIVHCASGTGTARGLMYRSARKTDVEATVRLLGDAKLSGEPHVLYISIVGIDRIPLGYYRAKLDTEHVIEASGLPYTILRTTQWHTLALEFCERLSRFPFTFAPKGVGLQLLDPGEVADRMVSLIEARLNGHAPEMGGPEAIEFKDVVASFLRAIGKTRRVTALRLPGKAMKGLRAGYNLTLEHADGHITWADWLAQNVKG